MKKSLKSGLLAAALAAFAFAGPAPAQNAPKPTAAKLISTKLISAKLTASHPVNLSKTPTLYVVGYSHLDTEWCWTYPQVINEFIPNTLHQNFALFEKYPDYLFNWTGANRYKFIKEYYPADYQTLKKYVAAGRWYPNGSSLEEGDVDIPSEESIIRQVMYGNEFFHHEFGQAGDDFMLPDCFGFPASLPSILAHCGVKGFSTQKLTWGSAVGIPFNVGVWEGPDGQSIFAALNAGDYTERLNSDLSHNAGWEARLAKDDALSGINADYMYYGVGDRGGAVRDSDAANLETNLHGDGPIHVVSARADQLFKDLTPADKKALPHYQGDLLLTWHSSGSATSQAEMKRWNHENEKLADAAERASVTADWLGALPYDKARITDAWWKFLPGQFHDLMAGTALPLAYDYAWNDQVLALNEFSGVMQEAVGGVTRGLDTSGIGIPVVVYNPLSTARRDIVEAAVTFPGPAPAAVRVTGPDGASVPAQIVSRAGNSAKLLLLASVPSVGYAAFTVHPGAAAPAAPGLKVTADSLENARYRVRLNAAGDVASVYDKTAKRELLASPMRLSFQYENPAQYPAWNMDYADQTKPPEGYVDGPAKISITENGPVRVALTVDRWANGSHFVETIRLGAGETGDRVEFFHQIDWQSQECALMAVLPLTVSNPEATYNWELGTIKRSTDDPAKYEVPAHQWFDLTNTNGDYGVSVLSGDRYGSDKPNGNTLRLTLLYTPGVRAGYTHQKTQDLGHHDLTYAITGHSGGWQNGGTQWAAMRLDHPMIAFQAAPHPGVLGRAFSFVHTGTPQVSVEALKQAEASQEVVVRFNELAGRPEHGVTCTFAAPVLAAREINGQEQPLGPAAVRNGSLVFDMSAYRPRAFALTLGVPPVRLAAPQSSPLKLAYNANVEKAFGSASGGSFDGSGSAIPADMLPASLVSDGVHFALAPSGGSSNAVECRGQSIALPKGSGGRLYLLAASDSGDVPAAFTLAGRKETRTIQAWNGMIGQWDDRVWGGEVPKLTYDQTNPVIGLKPGFIKRDPVAWYSDHVRAADGTNAAYAYCYLFRYALDIPAGCTHVTLPNNPNVKILAATVAADPNEAITPAQSLYDTLQHPETMAPHIDLSQAADGASDSVVLSHPLYFSQGDSLHYTLDGTAPTAQSPVYADPFTVSQAATIKAAYVRSDGSIEGTAAANAAVAHPSGPQVTAVTALSPSVVQVTFSEPVSEASATNPANCALTPAADVASASLGANGETVTLNLPASAGRPSALSVQGVQSSAVPRMTLRKTGALPISALGVVYENDAVQTFDGSSGGFTKQPLTPMPTAGASPWTMNLFAYFDTMPGELTTLAGFGDDSDTAGTQRYLLKFHDGIHFWGSNVDVTSGVPYDIGKWQMITATYDGKTLTLYKNGKAIKAADIALSDAAPVVKIAPPGPWPNGSRMNGKIAGFRLWNAALSPDAVADLMQSQPK